MPGQKNVLPIAPCILDHLKEAILLTDQNGIIVTGNPSAYKLLDTECALNKRIDEFIDMSFGAFEEMHQLVELYKNKGTFIELKGIKVDDTYYCFYLKVLRISDKVRELKQYMTNFMANYLEGIIIYDENSGAIIDCDSNCATMFRYTKRQLQTKKLTDLFTNDSLHAFHKNYHIQEFIHELTAFTKYGDQFYVEMLQYPLLKEIMVNVCLLKDVTEQVRNKKRIEYLAYYDELTDLPNRNYFICVLQQAIEQAAIMKQEVAVYTLGLDYFKEINDILGYSVGDELIRYSALRLKNFLQSDTFVARMAGDEFIILQSGINNKKEIISFAERLIRTFEHPIKINGYDIYTSVTIGISLYPNHGEEAEDLIKHANLAMYDNKNKHRNNYKFFEPAISKKFQSTITLESELREAIKDEQLELHYQPQVDFQTNRIVGMEALLRWKHPEKGYIPPNEFITIAEKTGLIIEIGEWVIYEACKQNKAWQDEGFEPFVISVNLSAIQFHQKDLILRIKHILNRTKLDPAYLELEITETMAMTNEQAALQILHKLRDLGILVSIDDFGTGYSSLKLLSLFPISKLKIDKIFMENRHEENQLIVKSIIHLCHLLNMRVVAEGVETEEQFAFLKAEQCDELQGFYFSKPLPPNEVSRLLTKHH
ncbi:MAG: GGDEF and EAL domain-containing protein [Virgibacillus proomii]|jgi:diguanylate cyclase (GGDEF)-like protein/PAS domain S-box-containing protein